jgi:hypothetical protein
MAVMTMTITMTAIMIRYITTHVALDWNKRPGKLWKYALCQEFDETVECLTSGCLAV